MPSLITMIGRSAASGAFDRDFSSPRHSARKPADRIGAADIDAEFGPLDLRPLARCFVRLGVVWRGADATTSGIGAAVTGLAGSTVRSALPAAGSGGAMIDFDATSGVAGVASSLGHPLQYRSCGIGRSFGWRSGFGQ